MDIRWIAIAGMLVSAGCVSRVIELSPGTDGEAGGEADVDVGDDEPAVSADGAQLPDSCDLSSHDTDCDGDGIPDADDPVPGDPDGPGPARADVIYVNTPDSLYMFDPKTLAFEAVGPFVLNGIPLNAVVDIAIDRFGLLYALTSSSLYACDPTTVACWYVADTTANSAGFVPAGVADPIDDVLVVVEGSTVVQIALRGNSAERIEIGSLGGYSSSGDVAHLADGRTLLTSPSAGDNIVIAFDPATANVLEVVGTVAGSTAAWGLASFDGRVFVFDDSGSIFEFDPTTAATTALPNTGAQLWGAASHPAAG